MLLMKDTKATLRFLMMNGFLLLYFRNFARVHANINTWWKMGHPTGWTTNWLWPCSAIRPSEQVPLSDEHWRWCEHKALVSPDLNGGLHASFEDGSANQMSQIPYPPLGKWSFLRCPGNFHNVHHEHENKCRCCQICLKNTWPVSGWLKKVFFYFLILANMKTKLESQSKLSRACVCCSRCEWFDVATERIWDTNLRSGVFSDFPSCWNLSKVYAISQYTCCSPLTL